MTTEQATVVIYRESAFIAGRVTLTVGADNRAFANIENGEKVEALLGPGKHDIYVQARSAESTHVQVSLTPGATVCLRTSSSPSTLAKVMVPITLMLTGYHFYLDELPCSPELKLDKYTAVPVAYE